MARKINGPKHNLSHLELRFLESLTNIFNGNSFSPTAVLFRIQRRDYHLIWLAECRERAENALRRDAKYLERKCCRAAGNYFLIRVDIMFWDSQKKSWMLSATPAPTVEIYNVKKCERQEKKFA